MNPRRLQRATIFSIVTASVAIRRPTLQTVAVPSPPRLTRFGTRILGVPMPIYEYRCDNGHTLEVMQRMADDPLSSCTTCDAPVQRVFHPIAVHFDSASPRPTMAGTSPRALTTPRPRKARGTRRRDRPRARRSPRSPRAPNRSGKAGSPESKSSKSSKSD